MTHPRPLRIYVASSWRNEAQPVVVELLREHGFDPYDFRHPAEGDDGFSWRDVEEDVVLAAGLETGSAIPAKGDDLVPVDRYLEMLEHPAARHGFGRDFDAMRSADVFVLVLPCGRSAHLELGWAIGFGKPTAILLEDPAEPELMYLLADHLAPTFSSVVDWLEEIQSRRARSGAGTSARGTGLYGGLR
jgi:hypothetical protein